MKPHENVNGATPLGKLVQQKYLKTIAPGALLKVFSTKVAQ